MATLKQVIETAERLVPMPAAVAKVAATLADPSFDPEGLVQAIRRDEVLTGAVLRRANSVAFGGRAGFDLRRSVARLGARQLMQVVLERSAARVFGGSGAAFGLVRGALWRSAIGGAVGAEMLGRRHHADEPELCYVVGLLRDIGKVALEAHFGPDYFAVLRPHLDPSRTFVECERDALGFDHAEVGAAIVEHWGFEPRLARAVRHHHEPPAGEAHDPLTDVVHAADALCLWAGLAVGHDGMAYRVAPHVRERLALGPREVEADVAAVWSAVREIEESLNAPPAQERSA